MTVIRNLNPSRVKAGTLVVIARDQPPVVVLHSNGYEVGDGELILTTEGGNFLHFLPGDWLAVGTLHHAGRKTYVALEAFAEERS